MKLKQRLSWIKIYKIFISSMSSRQSGALKSVEVMLNASLKRLNSLNGENREALYDEYKEWLEIDDNNVFKIIK